MASEALIPGSPSYDPVFAARVAQARMNAQIQAAAGGASAPYGSRRPWYLPEETQTAIGAVTPVTLPSLPLEASGVGAPVLTAPVLTASVLPEREPVAGEPGFGVLAPGRPASDYRTSNVTEPEVEPIENLRARLGFSWGRDVPINPATGRPATSTIVGEGTLSRPRTLANEAAGGGGVSTARMEDLPLGQRPPSYWAERGLGLEDLSSRVAMARGTRELERTQLSQQIPGFTVGEELAARTDPRQASMAQQQSILIGLSELASALARAQATGDQATVARAQQAYDTGTQLAKLYLTAISGRNLGLFNPDPYAFLGQATEGK